MSTRRNLWADQDGLVMVSGLFMALLAIGAAWYVIGMGQAVQYRETLQNGADATAFAAAVYDARGMNILAMINMVMAAVLAIFVFFRIVQGVVLVVNIISCILAWTGVGAFVCADTTADELPLEDTINTISPFIEWTLRVLHYVEGGVAVVWPWLAEGESETAAADYQPGVVGGITWATSQIPVSLNNPGDWVNSVSGVFSISKYVEDYFKKRQDAAAAGSASGASSSSPPPSSSSAPPASSGGSGSGSAPAAGSQKSVGDILKGIAKQFGSLDGWFKGRYGLPVQNDTFQNTCTYAAYDVFDLAKVLVVGPLQLGPVQSLFQSVVSGLAHFIGNYSFFFCEGSNEQAQDILSFFQGLTAQKGQKPPNTPAELKAKCDDNGKKAAAQAKKDGKTADEQKKLQQEAVDQCTKSNGKPQSQTARLNSKDLTTKTLYTQSSFGDDYYAIWSTAVGRYDDSFAPTVNVAQLFSKNKTTIAAPSPDSAVGVAKAEFYYEPRPGDVLKNETGGNPADPTNALWNMRWRARLRRYRQAAAIPLLSEFLTALRNQALTQLSTLIQKRMTNLSQDQIKQDYGIQAMERYKLLCSDAVQKPAGMTSEKQTFNDFCWNFNLGTVFAAGMPPSPGSKADFPNPAAWAKLIPPGMYH